MELSADDMTIIIGRDAVAPSLTQKTTLKLLTNILLIRSHELFNITKNILMRADYIL